MNFFFFLIWKAHNFFVRMSAIIGKCRFGFWTSLDYLGFSCYWAWQITLSFVLTILMITYDHITCLPYDCLTIITNFIFSITFSAFARTQPNVKIVAQCKRGVRQKHLAWFWEWNITIFMYSFNNNLMIVIGKYNIKVICIFFLLIYATCLELIWSESISNH